VDLLAAGRDSDVFAYADGLVLRRYRDGRSAAGEVAVIREVAALGYPVPAVHEAAGPDIVMERVVGPTLAEALVAGMPPDEAGALLAGLHDRLHALAWPGAAPGEVLLHLDLHGANVLLHGGAQLPFVRAAAPRVPGLPARVHDPASWRVIDPHASVGDRHADCWALLDPLVPPLPAAGAGEEARRRVGIYAAAAGLHPGRTGRWAWARGRAEARELDAIGALSGHDRAWAARLHATADALASVVGCTRQR